MRSDPLCGDQFNEPPGCVYDLHVYDLNGEQQLFVPALAPYGAYNEWIKVEVAARTDGYLVSWNYVDGWHAQPVDATGSPGGRFDYEFSSLGWSTLLSTDTGYIGVWPEPSQGYLLPRLLRLDPDGAPGEPEWVTDPGGPLTRQYAVGVMAASVNGGIGVAWTGAGGDDATDYTAGLRFRSLGCTGP